MDGDKIVCVDGLHVFLSRLGFGISQVSPGSVYTSNFLLSTVNNGKVMVFSEVDSVCRILSALRSLGIKNMLIGTRWLPKFV